jgi:hypothetical protein
MNFANYGCLLHPLAIQLPFFFKGFYIGRFYGMVGGYLFVATAIGTKRFAKRQVNLQADAIGVVLFMKPSSKCLFPGIDCQGFVPGGHCRITGIPGNRLIVFPDQQGVDRQTLHHLSKLEQPQGAKADGAYVPVRF